MNASNNIKKLIAGVLVLLFGLCAAWGAEEKAKEEPVNEDLPVTRSLNNSFGSTPILENYDSSHYTELKAQVQVLQDALQALQKAAAEKPHSNTPEGSGSAGSVLNTLVQRSTIDQGLISELQTKVGALEEENQSLRSTISQLRDYVGDILLRRERTFQETITTSRLLNLVCLYALFGGVTNALSSYGQTGSYFSAIIAGIKGFPSDFYNGYIVGFILQQLGTLQVVIGDLLPAKQDLAKKNN